MRRAAATLVLLALALPAPAGAASAPVLRSEVAAGTGTTVPLRPRADGPRRVDGDASDWGGRLPGFGGALAYSHGELVYQDHIFDAYGADNGQDAQRLAVQDPLEAAVPETYRIDPALQYVPQEFGIPTGPFTFDVHYGDLPHTDQADLSEVRLGTDRSGAMWLLARTTTMADDKPATALLVLLDTKPPTAQRAVPFASGLTTRRGDVAVLLTGDHGWWADLTTGAVQALPGGSVATDPAGYGNTLEARLPVGLLGGRPDAVGVAVAAGLAGDGAALKDLGGGPRVANVAFRTAEPARDWWDKQQALALQRGTIDEFYATADLRRMRAGADERYVPGPGYHDRIFTSSPLISAEHGQDGVLQHYGVYIPTGYRAGRATPTQYWLHFRGGNAHIAAAVAPGIFQDMGEDVGSIVITPDGRGTSGWYVGRSHVDFLEVWADSHRLLDIDRDRTYMAGHSMGGWASYLLPVLYPDRFAATFPASGPPTQGLWAGCDADPCFGSANGGRPRDELTYPLLDNLRGVPLVSFHGTEDELVPVTGAIKQAERLRELGFRYRLYLFPGQEHYGPPVVDQWAEGARYEHAFTRDPNPAQVTYVRSMPFERAIEQVNAEKLSLDFSFDRAYWMSGLEPVDGVKGVARFEGRSLAIPERPHGLVPEAGAPTADQAGPYAMEGQAWTPPTAPAPPARNAFTARLTGARAVTLDTRRMRLDPRRDIEGDVTTDAPVRLTITGVGTYDLAAGHHTLVVRRAGRARRG
jgi:predicted esterase